MDKERKLLKVIAAAGIRENNVYDIVQNTGVHGIHAGSINFSLCCYLMQLQDNFGAVSS